MKYSTWGIFENLKRTEKAKGHSRNRRPLASAPHPLRLPGLCLPPAIDASSSTSDDCSSSPSETPSDSAEVIEIQLTAFETKATPLRQRDDAPDDSEEAAQLSG